MEEEKKNARPPMKEATAVALAIAGLYGEALRAGERGDLEQAAMLQEAFNLLQETLSAERGDTSLTNSLCATMLRAHDCRMQERERK